MKVYVEIEKVPQSGTTTKPNQYCLSIKGVASREKCEEIADWLFRMQNAKEMRKIIKLEDKLKDQNRPAKKECPECKVKLKNGIALAETYITHADFIGDKSDRGCTMSPGGSGKLIPVLKCSECGYSIG